MSFLYALIKRAGRFERWPRDNSSFSFVPFFLPFFLPSFLPLPRQCWRRIPAWLADVSKRQRSSFVSEAYVQSTFCACMRSGTKEEEQPTGKLLSLRGDPPTSTREKLWIELRATEIGGGISSLRTTISLTYLFYLCSTHATKSRIEECLVCLQFQPSQNVPCLHRGNAAFFLTDCSLMTTDTERSVDVCFVNRNKLAHRLKYQ